MGSGPVIVGYDGTDASRRALTAATLLRVYRIMVVHIWDPEVVVDVVQSPIPPSPVSTEVVTMERKLAERASNLAAKGAQIARDLDLHSESVAVPTDSTVGATLVRLARDYDAAALVVGYHARRSLHGPFVGSTVRELIKAAPCPIVVAGEGCGRATA